MFFRYLLADILEVSPSTEPCRSQMTGNRTFTSNGFQQADHHSEGQSILTFDYLLSEPLDSNGRCIWCTFRHCLNYDSENGVECFGPMQAIQEALTMYFLSNPISHYSRHRHRATKPGPLYGPPQMPSPSSAMAAWRSQSNWSHI